MIEKAVRIEVGITLNALDFNLDQTRRPEVTPELFYWEGDILHRTGMASVNCTSFGCLDPLVKQSFKNHWIEFISSSRYACTSAIGATQALRIALIRFPVKSFDKPWILRALTQSSFLVFKGPIQAFFQYWKERHEYAITSDALYYLTKIKTSRPRSDNVLSDNPEKSWLTEIEYDALLQAIWVNYDKNFLGSQPTLMRLLSMQYARRPAQIAQLKVRDFQDVESYNADQYERTICFPGVKDQLAPTGFRDSKFEVHPIADHLWDLFRIQQSQIKSLFESTLGIAISGDKLKELPLFTNVAQIKKAVGAFEGHMQIDWRENLGSELFHILPSAVSKVLHWENNRSFFGYAERTTRIEPPLSHRTGRPIIVTATRMRHTRARQLARLGMPKHVLSHWLGHTSELSLDAYYNDPAEEARKLNEAMRDALMPLALVFTGKLLDDESQASRANEPESRLEFASNDDLKNVGSCGKYSFCTTTSVPIPCYRCKHFEPLVFAPHDEVLRALRNRQAEEEKMIKIGGHRKLLVPIDLSADIRAVQACIEHCNARITELESSSA